jgi:hypothetical protein
MTLLEGSGTETYVRDLAVVLRRRGHRPMVYAPRTGRLAEEVRDAGIPVRERLSDLETPPDVIHGHHNLPTMAALLRFPGAPAVYVCHSRTFWADAPPLFPRIHRYVAVDHHCRERLVLDGVIAERRIRVVYNSVDLDRFRPRERLPARPRRALLFSNYANEQTHLPAVREACARTGLDLQVIGSGVNNTCPHPEAILGQFDLVFAKARCALEALAVGTAVVLSGPEGSGPIVRLDMFDDLRRFNFGHRTLTGPVTADALEQQIRRYDAAEAAAVSAQARAEVGLDRMVTELLETYGEALLGVAEADAQEATEEALAAARYLCSLEPPLFAYFAAEDKILHLEAEVRRLAVELAQIRAPAAPAFPFLCLIERVRRSRRPRRWLRALRGWLPR